MNSSNIPKPVQDAQKTNNSQFISQKQYDLIEDMTKQQINLLNKKKETYLNAMDMPTEERFKNLQEADKEINAHKKDLDIMQKLKVKVNFKDNISI